MNAKELKQYYNEWESKIVDNLDNYTTTFFNGLSLLVMFNMLVFFGDCNKLRLLAVMLIFLMAKSLYELSDTHPKIFFVITLSCNEIFSPALVILAFLILDWKITILAFLLSGLLGKVMSHIDKSTKKKYLKKHHSNYARIFALKRHINVFNGYYKILRYLTIINLFLLSEPLSILPRILCIFIGMMTINIGLETFLFNLKKHSLAFLRQNKEFWDTSFGAESSSERNIRNKFKETKDFDLVTDKDIRTIIEKIKVESIKEMVASVFFEDGSAEIKCYRFRKKSEREEFLQKYPNNGIYRREYEHKKRMHFEEVYPKWSKFLNLKIWGITTFKFGFISKFIYDLKERLLLFPLIDIFAPVSYIFIDSVASGSHVAYEENRFCFDYVNPSRFEDKEEYDEYCRKIVHLKKMSDDLDKIYYTYYYSKKEETYQFNKTYNGTDYFKDCNDFNSVKTEYHKLAKKYHPDNNPENETVFKEVTEQYEFLKINLENSSKKNTC